MFKKSLAAAALLALSATGSWAAPSVSCTTGVENCAYASDNVLPVPTTLWTTDTAFWEGVNEAVVVDLGGVFIIGQVFLALDNNDSYVVESSLNGGTWTLLGSVAASDGSVPVSPGGMDWFTSAPDTPFSVGTLAFAPTSSAYLRVRATGGDDLYSVGEINWTAAPAVPEPGSLALMLAGAAGLVLRRRAAR